MCEEHHSLFDILMSACAFFSCRFGVGLVVNRMEFDTSKAWNLEPPNNSSSSHFTVHFINYNCCFDVPVGLDLRKNDKRTWSSAGIPCCSMQQSPPPAWPGRAVVEPGHTSWDSPKPIAIVGSTGSIGTQVGFFIATQLVCVYVGIYSCLIVYLYRHWI